MEKKGILTITERPDLKKPNMVCGIGGWTDGGKASTGTVAYLRRTLGATRFAEMDVQRFHVFQLPGENSNRPHIKIEDGLVKVHTPPANEFFYWSNRTSEHDLVLFLGSEPSLNWWEYAETLLDFATELGVRRIYLPGGVLDQTPHTREPIVSCYVSDARLKTEMNAYTVQYSAYEGPGSFGATLTHFAADRGMELVGLTARTTYYPEFNIVLAENARAILAILKRLRKLLDINLDLSPIEEASRDLEGKLNFMIGQNAKLRAYVAELEKNYVERRYQEPLDITAGEAVEIAEEFLRKEDEMGKGKQG
ncbi:MAG: PAC2 family protein [Dehalococcoidia bacterium]|nr:PAC2 family protein [Dehalococcoidia bacterium]